MTPRARFQRLMRYEQIDRLPVVAIENYHEDVAIARWQSEGLPADRSPEEYLGMDYFVYAPLNLMPIPGFEYRVIAEDEESYTEIDSMGTTIRRDKSAPSMYYGYLDHPVKNMGDWERYRERFRVDSPGRLPENLPAVVAALNASPYPVGLSLFPWFFRLGFYLLGMERFMTAVYDMPELLHAMFSFWGQFAITLVEQLLAAGLKLDFAAFIEDSAYKTGPHFSPATYREFWLPYQDPLVELLQQYHVARICLWTAGNIDVYLPMLLEHGINCTWPVERCSSMDPVALRAQYGRRLFLGGGINKQAFIDGPSAIDSEIARLMPLIREGGFLPAIDDVVPPEVPFSTYQYYINALRAIKLSG